MPNSSHFQMTKTRNAISRTAGARAFCLLVCAGLSVSEGLLAQTAAKPVSPAASQKTTPATAPETKKSEPADVLVQLNGALESLAARVSPAVVQILVTGYGPLRESREDRPRPPSSSASTRSVPA